MKNFSKIVDNFDVTTKKYVDDGLAEKANSADLATVATSGSYNDLSNKPTIPDVSGKLDKTGGTITGDLTVGGSLTINGTTTTVDSTTLQVKDKLIEVAHENTTALTTPAGLIAPKYDGTNSGALVFDSTGTAYVGDVNFTDNGDIDVANSQLQPLATRTGLVGGNLVQYDSSAQTLKDSGKKISDLATTSQVNAKYTKPSGGIPKTDLSTAVQNSLTAADNAMPKSGGTFTGNVSLSKELVFTDNTNPFIKMTTGGTAFYFQSTSGQFGLGPTWDKATHWDSNGNVTFPTTPKVGSSSLALTTDIPTNHVTTDTPQTISGAKTFTAQPIINTPNGLKFTSGNCALRIYNTSASPTDYSAIEVRSNSSSTNRNLFIDLANNSLVVGQASGTADTTYKVNVKDSFNATTIYENGTSLANKYLGKTSKAADADKLDGNDSTYYLNYDNLTNKPTIPTKVSELTNDSGYTTNKGTVTQVKINGTTNSPDSAGLVDLGTISGGSSDNSKFDYTVLTNEDLNTVIVAGRYRGENGNTCKHKPFVFPTAAFFLTVEKTESGLITQTACLAADQISSFYTWSVRHSTNNGSSWSGWKNQQSMDNSASQVFSGIKTFDYINIRKELQFSDDEGSNGQFAMSQGPSVSPKWVNLQVRVNGTTYTADSSGLIDLGEISGGGGASTSQYNDIY